MKVRRYTLFHYLKYLITPIVLFSLDANAAVYQYIDKSGRTHFSDQPFQYKQPTVKQENRNRRLRPSWIKTDRKSILGKWFLFATSASKNGKLKRQSDTWVFNKDGSYEARSIVASREKNIRYYITTGNLEIESGAGAGRDTYNVIDLSPEKMVLRLDSSKHYFYFERANTRLSKFSVKNYYGRSQVATVVGLLACGEISGDMSTLNLFESVQKKIFLKTGIVKFDKEKFIASVDFYKTDETFKDIYEPKINQYLKRCAKLKQQKKSESS